MKRYHQNYREGILTEIQRDFSVIKKYFLYILAIISVLSFLVYYNTLNIKKDRDIANLIREKNIILAENLKLQKEITVLSSPQRIEKIAKEKLNMFPVSFDSIKFLEVDE